MDRWARAKLDADRLLAADGFVDAECGEHMRNPLHRTSSHGRDVPAAVLAPLEEARRRDAAAYREWAEGVLRRWRFRSRTERDVWARHASGEGLRDIARAVGWTYHRTRTTVGAIRERAKCLKDQAKGSTQCGDTRTLREVMRRCDLSFLLDLVAVAVRTRKPSSSAASG